MVVNHQGLLSFKDNDTLYLYRILKQTNNQTQLDDNIDVDGRNQTNSANSTISNLTDTTESTNETLANLTGSSSPSSLRTPTIKLQKIGEVANIQQQVEDILENQN
jgi:hypothetical protein